MIRTTNSIEISDGFLNTKPVILYGQIKEALWTNDFKNLLVIGEYFYYENDVKITAKYFKDDSFDETKINQVTEAVEDDILETSKTDKERKLFDLAFRILMSQEYGINLNNIELFYPE